MHVWLLKAYDQLMGPRVWLLACPRMSDPNEDTALVQPDEVVMLMNVFAILEANFCLIICGALA